MINKYITTFICIWIFCMTAMAQQKDTTSTLSGRMEQLIAMNPWLQLDNAAAVAGLNGSIGATSAGTSFEEGDFRRPQQAARSSQVFFQSERYQQLSKGSLYGSFNFRQQWDKNIQMSEVMDPYRGNPFILADSIGGNWKKQLYELTLKAATKAFAGNKLTAGIGIVFNAGTGARQNDPRPLTTVNDITLTPSLIWTMSPESRLGINGVYNSYKEEVSVSVTDQTLNQKIYLLTGLATYFPPANILSYLRNYRGKTYGGDIQYAWSKGRLSWLSSIGYRTRNEAITDGGLRPSNGGMLEEKQYKIYTNIRYRAGRLHHILSGDWTQYDRTGIEEHQLFNNDPAVLKYETFLKSPLSTSLVTVAVINYQLLKLRSNQDFCWQVTAGVIFNGLDNRYNFPRALQIADRLEYSLGASRNWGFSSGRNLVAGIKGAFTSRITSREENNLNAGSTNLVAYNYFYPDHGYLSSESYKAEVYLQYAFSVPQVSNTQFFVKGNGWLQQQTGRSYYGVSGNRSQFSITLGAFY